MKYVDNGDPTVFQSIPKQSDVFRAVRGGARWRESGGDERDMRYNMDDDETCSRCRGTMDMSTTRLDEMNAMSGVGPSWTQTQT